MFGAALAALPPAPRHFTLYFRFESDELTDESRALVPEILQTVKSAADPGGRRRRAHGHDGGSRANIALGLKRAISVRDLLVEAGLAASTIEVTSHGEGRSAVQTPDDTPEPRNRRVEITVR